MRDGKHNLEDLTAWGWTLAWEEAARTLREDGQVIGRVTAVYRDKCLVRFAAGERFAEVAGHFRHEAEHRAEFPVVGDWVLAREASAELAIIHRLLPRKNVLSRKVAGQEIQEQILASNVDVVFVVAAFDEDFNARRIQRYVVMARQAGMECVILLNKNDLSVPDDERLSQAQAANPDAKIHRISAKSREEIDVVASLLRGARTGLFLGSSGVGKSTLLNALVGGDVQKTQAIRVSDGKGRHTTVTRQMFILPSGGLVIDTPGIREIQLWGDETTLSDAFLDITQLAETCRYTDCRHGSEPGCAVRAAVESGTLAAERFEGFMKLRKELAYLERKLDPEQRSNSKRRWKKIHAAARSKIRTKSNPEDI